MVSETTPGSSAALVDIVDPGLAIESLRDSDFDTASAVGEIIDNAIQANAKKIEIWTKENVPARRKNPYICEITFIDDGIGMDRELLHHCLKLGYSSRSNARGDSIGRFGVGATLAGIHECRCIEVISRPSKKMDWLGVYLDLDEIQQSKVNGERPGIKPPSAVKPPSVASNFVPDTGTIVKWTKIDRMSDHAEKTSQELIHWIGRTYRYFIWDDDVQIYYNGHKVLAHDPLYHRTENTNFPNDPKSKLFDPIEIEWDIDEVDRHHTGDRNKSTIVVHFSMLPQEWRRVTGDGGNKFARERKIEENEGISILRNRREVFYGHIPYWKPAFKEEDRWWGCEISFKADLDRAFLVRNIKRGATPIPSLKDHLQLKLNGTIHTARREYKEEKEKKEPGSTSDSELGKVTEPVVKVVKVTRPTRGAKVSPQKWVDEQPEADRIAILSRLEKLPLIVEDKSWSGHSFFDVKHYGGKTIVEINKQHIFFDDLIKLKEKQKSITYDELTKLIGLIIASFAAAQGQIPEGIVDDSEDLLSDLRGNWGKELRNFLKKTDFGD